MGRAAGGAGVRVDRPAALLSGSPVSCLGRHVVAPAPSDLATPQHPPYTHALPGMRRLAPASVGGWAWVWGVSAALAVAVHEWGGGHDPHH